MNDRFPGGASGSTHFLFRITGLVACASACILNLISYWYSGLKTAQTITSNLGLATEMIPVVFWLIPLLLVLGYVLFAGAFWVSTRAAPYSVLTGASLLSAQVAFSFLLEPELQYIIAAELPFILRLRGALIWLVIQNALMIVVLLATAEQMEFKQITIDGFKVLPLDASTMPPWSVILSMVMVGHVAWQFFAFCVGFIAAAERRSRSELARAHAELLATQQLLADSARASERLRMARDLHDGMGHHLTALGLHLDLAERQAQSQIAGSLATSRDIVRQLMAEVRTTVGVARVDRPIDLCKALRTLFAGMPSPPVDLSVADGVEVTDPLLAHTIFRAVQEGVSNAVRHACASRVRVTLAEEAGGIGVCICDDGRGMRDIVPGNGLKGMRERVEDLGGRIEIDSPQGRGCCLRIWLPQRGEQL